MWKKKARPDNHTFQRFPNVVRFLLPFPQSHPSGSVCKTKDDKESKRRYWSFCTSLSMCTAQSDMNFWLWLLRYSCYRRHRGYSSCTLGSALSVNLVLLRWNKDATTHRFIFLFKSDLREHFKLQSKFTLIITQRSSCKQNTSAPGNKGKTANSWSMQLNRNLQLPGAWRKL